MVTNIKYPKPELTSYDQERLDYLRFDEIRDIVGDFYNITAEQMQHKTRRKEVVKARFFTMYITYANTKIGSEHLGEYFGGRDHTTVLHAIKTIHDQLTLRHDNPHKDEYHQIVKLLPFQAAMYRPRRNAYSHYNTGQFKKQYDYAG